MQNENFLGPFIKTLGYAALLGVIATAFLDLVNYAQHVLLNKPLTHYELIGRWILYILEGQFYHPSIKASAAKTGELAVGWFVHYAIGVLFALLLLVVWSLNWLNRPRIIPALIVGLVTCAIPYFLMQPGMGKGIAGILTPNPIAVQLKVLISHLFFALGLIVGAYALRLAAKAKLLKIILRKFSKN